MYIKTNIKTIHEESYNNSDTTIGVLENYSKTNKDFITEALFYLYKEKSKTYIFFFTMIELMEYLMYGNKNVTRSYLEETEFDKFYDKTINSPFKDKLIWVKSKKQI